jgi:chromosome segregation ATPase
VQTLTKLQEQRETWETKSINVMKQLQDLEIKRINHLKSLFCEIAQTFDALLPEIEKVRCLSLFGNWAPWPL